MKKIILVGLSLAMCASAGDYDYCYKKCNSKTWYESKLRECEFHQGRYNTCQEASIAQAKYNLCMNKCLNQRQGVSLCGTVWRDEAVCEIAPLLQSPLFVIARSGATKQSIILHTEILKMESLKQFYIMDCHASFKLARNDIFYCVIAFPLCDCGVFLRIIARHQPKQSKWQNLALGIPLQ